MSDYALGANPKNGTSVITETGIVVYNAVQDEAEILARSPHLGSVDTNKVAAVFPREMCFTRTGRMTAAVARTNTLPMQGLQPAWADFRGAEWEHPSNFRHVGESRNTPQLQGMPGRELGRAFALKYGGSGTIRLISALPVAARDVLMWDVPCSANLPTDLSGYGRKLAEVKVYKPSECLNSPLKMHQLVRRQGRTPVNPSTLNNEEEIELSQALLFVAAVRTIGFTSMVTARDNNIGGAPLTSAQKLQLAVQFGLIDPDDTTQTAAAEKKASQAFVNKLIDAVFVASYNEKTQVSHTDEALAAFVGAEVDLKGGKVRGAAGDPKKKQVKRSQMMCVADITMSTATLIEARKTRIFAIAMTPGRPGQYIDVFYV